jgi:uncharacterized membrane-anchored protein YitT (DUF2179 family)
MNPFWTQIIMQTVIKEKHNTHDDKKDYSSFEIAKSYRIFKILAKRLIKDGILISVGIFSAAFGLKGFLLPNNFIDGGVTGISLLIAELTQIPLWLLIIGINIPFIFLGYNIMGKQFAIKTGLSITGLSIVLATVNFPNVIDDFLLASVFGGFFLGAGIGFSIRGGSVIDGTEVLAIFLGKKLSLTIGDIIIIINIIIFGFAAYFLNIKIALYSLITYVVASKTLDFIVEGIEEYIGATIVSSHSEEIRLMIIEKLGRGVTVFSGKRGFGKRGETKDVEIIYSVITRLEINKLTTEIEKIDPTAFVVMNSIKDTKGGMIKRRPLRH